MRDHLTDRNKLIEHVFAELQHIEQAMADGSPSQTSRYIDGGDWFIKPGFAIACLRKRLRRPTHQPILAGVSVKGLNRLWWSYLRNATVLFNSRAAAVNIRQRLDSCVIRSFYPFSSQPATVKASTSGHAGMEAEVKNRRIVEEIGILRAPKIIAKDFNARCPFLMEEFVTGRIPYRRRDFALLSQTLLPSLQRHYATFGVSSAPVKSCFGEDFYEKVEQATELLPWDQNWRDRRQFLSAIDSLANSEKQMTLSFCHGDLSVGHVAVSDDGRIYLLDWEGAKIRPITFDLAKIERTCRTNQIRLYDDCARLLSEVSLPLKSKDLFSPAEQLFLASLRRIFSWQANFQPHYELHGIDPAAELKLEFENAIELLKNV
jgi:hypothetical protein